MSLETDIDTMLAAMPDSKTLVFGALSGPCVVDSVDEQILQSGSKALRGKVVVATVRTTAFPGLKVGSTITIAGAPHRVRDRMTESDGLTMKLELEVL